MHNQTNKQLNDDLTGFWLNNENKYFTVNEVAIFIFGAENWNRIPEECEARIRVEMINLIGEFASIGGQYFIPLMSPDVQLRGFESDAVIGWKLASVYNNNMSSLVKVNQVQLN